MFQWERRGLEEEEEEEEEEDDVVRGNAFSFCLDASGI
jgi:hypothetical protein